MVCAVPPESWTNVSRRAADRRPVLAASAICRYGRRGTGGRRTFFSSRAWLLPSTTASPEGFRETLCPWSMAARAAG